MTSFKKLVLNLNAQDREFIHKHGLTDSQAVIKHMERISSIFTHVSVGMLQAFTPVIQAMHQFLDDMPKAINKEFRGRDDIER